MANSYANVAAGASTLTFEPKGVNTTGLFQVTFNSGAAGTVTLQERLSPDHAWKTVATFTGSDLIQITVSPLIQATYSIAGGTFSAAYWESL